MNVAIAVLSAGWRRFLFGRGAMLVALALFLSTRAATLTAFPIFNDEAIYLQYAQAIHEDWPGNKFISMNGRYNDWKPPLQYWLAAPFMELGNDPLVVGRMVALLFSLAGFVGFYAFSKELFGEAEGVLAVILYLLCPPVFLHNNQFIAETFLFSIAPCYYWAVLRALRADGGRWLWALLALGLGVLLLLLKQSGFLLLLVGLALPLAGLRRPEGGWKKCALEGAFIIALIALAALLAKMALPTEFDATRARFDSRWVLSISELLRLPFDVWRANFRIVGDYVGAYYTWAVPLLLGPLIWSAIRKRPGPELALILMVAGGGGAILFLLRGFNEYMFNTAIIAALLPLLARVGTKAWNLARVGRSGKLRIALLALAAFTLLHWSYQVGLMMIAPGRYIARSTPWAVANYLDGWPTGFGVKEVVALLDQIEGPAVVLIDPQWGNPRTAIEVYAKRRFSNLKFVPILHEFREQPEKARQVRDYAKTIAPVRLVIFSAYNAGARADWQETVHREMCAERTEVKADPQQMPIIVCRF